MIRIFEDVMGDPLAVRFVPAWLPVAFKLVLRPFNPRLSSLAALVAAGSRGDVAPMGETLESFPVALTSVRD